MPSPKVITLSGFRGVFTPLPPLLRFYILLLSQNNFLGKLELECDVIYGLPLSCGMIIYQDVTGQSISGDSRYGNDTKENSLNPVGEGLDGGGRLVRELRTVKRLEAGRQIGLVRRGHNDLEISFVIHVFSEAGNFLVFVFVCRDTQRNLKKKKRRRIISKTIILSLAMSQK